MSRIEVPITPSVLRWAINESGYTVAEVSEWVDGGAAALEDWLTGDSLPSITDVRVIASKLHLQLATFLLPKPPEEASVVVRFRHPQRGHQRPLNPIERRYLRRAGRLQDAHAWLAHELGIEFPDLPAETADGNAEDSAARFRSRLSISIERQRDWRSASVAFDGWREAVERLGIIVVLYPMTDESCRGFSLWHDAVPLVAINTAWRDEARIFTLFHECGHLLTRTDSACALADVAVGDAEDRAERWCESFAANVIIPEAVVAALPKVTELKSLSRIAGDLKVSLRAMAIRLIGSGKADWALYKSIPAAADHKQRGGAGGTGRNRREIREDELGHRGTRVFVEAVRRDVITASQALDYLDIPLADFDGLAQSVPLEP
jgi:Zn-dependent peptidase ImmA (M78 family)